MTADCIQIIVSFRCRLETKNICTQSQQRTVENMILNKRRQVINGSEIWKQKSGTS